MSPPLPDLTGLSIFLAVAETRSFRRAGERLGITRSAVSQAIRRLEDRFGTALVSRTTRSVSLTEAGETLFRRIAGPIAEVAIAIEEVGGPGEAGASGHLRLAVSSIAESFLQGSLLAGFIEAHPAVTVDVTVTDEEFDLVAHGFDAGVRLGEVLEADMIAVPVSDDQRQLVVGAPDYLRRFGTPTHPRELAKHRCIGWRRAPDLAPYRWEFTEDGRDFDVAVTPTLTTNDMQVMIRTALGGGGLTCGMEESFRTPIENGALVPVLEDFCPSFPGFFLAFPARRNMAPKLRALVDHVRRQARR